MLHKIWDGSLNVPGFIYDEATLQIGLLGLITNWQYCKI